MNTENFKRVCQFMQGSVSATTATTATTDITDTTTTADIVEPSMLDPIMQAKIHENYLATRKRLGYK